MIATEDRKTALQDARSYFVYRMGFVRGACILAIIACHLSPAAARHLTFGVPIFIILSGYYLSLNRRNERALALYRRTLKFLMLPYLIYSLIYAIPEAARGATPAELWRRFLSSEIEQHLWFMPTIIGLYLLHPWLQRSYRRARIVTCIVAVGVQAWLWPWLRTHGLPAGAMTTLLSFCAEIGYFVVGYLVHDQASAVRWFCARRSGTAICIGVVVAWQVVNGWLRFGLPAGPPTRVVDIAVTLAFYCLLTAMSQPAAKPGATAARWVARLGLYSFGIYLFHPLVLAASMRGVSRLFPPQQAPFAWYLLVFTVTTIGSLIAVRWLAARPWGKYLT